MVTSKGSHVINAEGPFPGDTENPGGDGEMVLSAARAAEHAGITYRQLDYWARQGWITPSVESEPGRRRRRRYSIADVARLGALGHFGRAGLDVGLLGERVGQLTLDPDLDELVIARADGRVEVAPGPELRARLTEEPEATVVFDPQRLYRTLGATGASPAVERSQAAHATDSSHIGSTDEGSGTGLEMVATTDRRSA